MAYERIIEHYDTDATTLIATISNGSTSSVVKNCEFELLRKGGCGSGSLELTYPFTSRPIEVGDHIKCKYDSSTSWYFGRVEEVEYNSPSGASVRMFGLWAYLNDIQIGGYGAYDIRPPQRYARSDYFVNDPDHSIQSQNTVSQPHQIINHLFTYYIDPESPITLGTVESPDVATEFTSMTFRGEENVSEVIRTVAMLQRDASYGVNANGQLFFINKNDTGSLKTYQEGVDVTKLSEITDRSLMFNVMLLTGGYVYGADTPSGFYRFLAKLYHTASVSAYGHKKIDIFVPWIRTTQDSLRFAQSFFDNYAGPTTRYQFTTNGQDTLYKPEDGRITLLDKAGSTLKVSTFDRVNIQFNEVPIFTFQLGPEEPQFGEPPEPQRFEVGDPGQPGDLPDPPQQSLSVPVTWTSVTEIPSSMSSQAPVSQSSGSPPSDACKQRIGGRPLNYYQGYAAGTKQALFHDSYGCVYWQGVEECS